MDKPKVWIAAVSGGVDSIVMLDRLVTEGRSLVVAHVDHGIRPDSAKSAQLVGSLAERYGLPYRSIRLGLGSSASEDRARQARHNWLRRMRTTHQAEAIATAHHQDDVIETMLLNLGRGTGWRGLASLRQTDGLRRPLLDWSKAEIINYALERGLIWQEDSTNQDVRLARNYIRHGMAARLEPTERRRLLELARHQQMARQSIEAETARLLKTWQVDGELQRHPLIMWSDLPAMELLRVWLGANYPRPTLTRLLHFCRTARAGKKFSLDRDCFVVANRETIVVLGGEDC